MKKRVQCLIIVLCMVISIMPTWALAEEPVDPFTEQTEFLESETVELPEEGPTEEQQPEGIVVEKLKEEAAFVNYEAADGTEMPAGEEMVQEEPVPETALETPASEEPMAAEPVSDEPAEELQNEETVPQEHAEEAETGEVTTDEPVGQPIPEEESRTEIVVESAEEFDIPEALAIEPATETEEIKLLDSEEKTAAIDAQMEGETVTLSVDSITLNSYSIKAGESLTVEVGTNASSVQVTFRNAAANQTVRSGIMLRNNNGVFEDTINVDNDQTAGVYTVDTVTLRSETGTVLERLTGIRFYGEGNENYAGQENKLDGALAVISFEVKANDEEKPAGETTQDITAPTVSGISLSTESLSAPGSVTVTVKTSEDILLGSYITFRNANADKTVTGILTRTENCTATALIQFDSNAANGAYVVDTVYVLDSFGNGGTYVGKGSAQYSNAENRLQDALSATTVTIVQQSAAPAISSVKKTTKGVKLSWNATGTSYGVLRKAEGERKYSIIAKEITGAEYTDNTVASGTKYSYKIRAYDASGKTIGTSKTKSVTFVAAPKLMSVSVSSAAIRVKWKSVQGAAAYRVMRKTGNGKWKILTNTTALSYTDSTVSIGTTYTYTVRCVNADGSKATSAYNTSGKTLTYLASPVIRSVSNARNGVKVSWAQVENAELYRVFRKVKGGKWIALKDTTALTYTDKTVESGTKYWYAVRCVTGNGKSYASSISVAKARTFIEATVLSSPSVEEGSVRLKWAMVVGAEKYRVFRKTENGSWKRLKDTTATGYVDKTAKAGTRYSYAIRCISADGSRYTSARSTAKTVTAK